MLRCQNPVMRPGWLVLGSFLAASRVYAQAPSPVPAQAPPRAAAPYVANASASPSAVAAGYVPNASASPAAAVPNPSETLDRSVRS